MKRMSESRRHARGYGRDARTARTPLAQGMSLLPYIALYQRMHRGRWRTALGMAVTAGALALWRRRRG